MHFEFWAKNAPKASAISRFFCSKSTTMGSMGTISTLGSTLGPNVLFRAFSCRHNVIGIADQHHSIDEGDIPEHWRLLPAHPRNLRPPPTPDRQAEMSHSKWQWKPDPRVMQMKILLLVSTDEPNT